MNTVMNSLKLGPSDVILTTSLVYNAVRVMCGAYCGDPGLVQLLIHIIFFKCLLIILIYV